MGKKAIYCGIGLVCLVLLFSYSLRLIHLEVIMLRVTENEDFFSLVHEMKVQKLFQCVEL